MNILYSASRKIVFIIKFHAVRPIDNFQIWSLRQHFCIGFGHLNGFQSKRIFNAHNFALRRWNQANASQSNFYGFAIVSKVHGYGGLFQADAGNTIFIGGGIIYFVHQSFGGDIRQADAGGIALTSMG